MALSSHICCTRVLHRFSVLLRIVVLGLLAASCSSGGESSAPPKSTNASLESLSIDGVVLEPAFSSSVTDYAATVDNQTASTHVTATAQDSDATITVNGSAVNSGSASEPIMLDEGDTTINVAVTAEDGITTRTYRVVVTRLIVLTRYDLTYGEMDFVEATHWEATLETSRVGIFTTELDIERFLNSTTYAVSLMNGDEVALSLDNSNSVWDVEFDLLHPGASATLSVDVSEITLDFSTPVQFSEADLYLRTVDSTSFLRFLQTNNAPGFNQVDIFNLEPDVGGEAFVEYDTDFVFPATSTFETAQPVSRNAWLESLSVDSVSLDTGFASSVTDYAVTVSCSIESTRISATASDPNATITVDGIEVASGAATDPIALGRGSNSITIVVTAEDGSTTQTYTVGVTRCGSDASLSSLALSSGNFQPPFSPSITEYQVLVPFGTPSVGVSATPNDENSTITINGGTETNVPLEIGENTIVVTVTADDGTTTRSYTIAITRDVSLSSLSLSAGELVPAFSPTVTEYQVSVPHGIRNVEVSATPNDEVSSVTINAGTATTVPLTVGENTIVVTVTAEDGTTTRSYTIAIVREDLGPDFHYDGLIGLELGNAVLTPSFSRYRFDYTATVPSGVTDTNVTATPTDSLTPFYGDPTVTINGGTDTNVPLSVGENLITISVIWGDGTTTRPYTVLVTRPAPDNAYLRSLELLTVASWDPPFVADHLEYVVAVGNFATSVQVAPAAYDANATILVNGSSVDSGSSSLPIALSEGDNAIAIEVASADDTAARTYTVLVKRQSALGVAQTAYVKSNNSGVDNFFGSSVSLSGNGTTLAVGAPKIHVPAWSESDYGAVDIYGRGSGGMWVHQVTVSGGGGVIEDPYGPLPYTDLFGHSLALSSDGATLAVGAPLYGSYRFGDHLELDPPLGAIYIFTRNVEGRWGASGIIQPGGYQIGFGGKLALSGNGETLAAHNGEYDCDGVVLYSLDGHLWTQQGQLDAPCRAANFTLSDDGAALAISRGNGTVAIYARNGSNVWSQSASLSLSSAPEIDSCLVATHRSYTFGCEKLPRIAFSSDGEMLAAGDLGNRSVSIYERGADGIWGQSAYATASVADATDGFGGRVALSADGMTLIVGASGEDSAATGIDGDETDNTAEQSGAAYLFTRAGDGLWTPRTYIKASNTDAGDSFGRVALSADGGTVVVGAPCEDSAATLINGDQANNDAECSGAAYIFELEDTP